ncbi:hypothetical protein [Salinisphaera sp. T31B1]|uniref:hypothetical protein n=1 Tax=Salinisphaera sp. T31B1 TaxID=727963 RepID=UPI00333FD55B
MSIATKKCRYCEESLPVDAFYANPGTHDGLDTKCRECAKAAARANRRKRIGYYREYDRQRYLRDGSRGEASPEAKRCGAAAWRARNPHKRKAQIAVGNALRDGRLTREPCCVCGETKTQAHHEDYSKPLAVVWLCTQHHAMQHRIEEATAKVLAAADDPQQQPTSEI